VPTSILTLNWANETSAAHNLDAALSPIDGKSREGFVFGIDLQVQIHVPDSRAPKVISMVGTAVSTGQRTTGSESRVATGVPPARWMAR